MRTRIIVFIGLALLVPFAAIVSAQSPAPSVTPPLDLVTLQDGSLIYGEIIELANGELKIKTSFGVGDIVTVKWANVAKLTANHPLPFHLKEGTVIVATAEDGPADTLVLKAAP